LRPAAGRAVAIETADIALMTDDLGKVNELMTGAKQEQDLPRSNHG